MDKEMLFSLLDSLTDPIVFVDTNHVIRFVNQAAKNKYAKRGHHDLSDKSIFDFHSPKSKDVMLKYYEELLKGETEKFLITNRDGFNVYMRSVRNKDNKLIGYFERFEKA